MQQTQFTHDPRLPGMAFGFFESQLNGHRVLGHAGSTTFFHSDLNLVPDRVIGWFITFNSPGGLPAIDVFNRAFADRYLPSAAKAVERTTLQEPSDPQRVTGRYKPLLRSHTKWDGAMLLTAGDIVVRAGDDGGIVVTSFGADQILEEIEPLLYREVDGDAMRAFIADDDGMITHMFDSTFSAVAIEKIRWFESVRFHRRLSIVVSVLALTALAPGAAGRRTAVVLSVLSGLLIPLFWWLFISSYRGAGHEVLIVSIPPGIMTALAIPLLISALTAVMVILVVRAWTKAAWSLVARVHYSIIALGLVAFLRSMGYWSLLGYQFG